MILEFTHNSWITNVKYDTDTLKMVINMKGDMQDYECGDVNLKDFEKFRDADSRGTHFNKHIKGKFISKDFVF